MQSPELREARLKRLRESRTQQEPPADFQDFWLATLTELMKVEPAPRPRAHYADNHGVVCGQFDSLGQAPISCWLSSERREADESRPLIVTSHGYGGANDPERVRRLASLGFDIIAVDPRGFGLSRDAVVGLSAYGYLLTGCETAHTCILRGAVCDYVQAYRAATSWFGSPSSVTFQGFSFAGGLALMATGALALAHRHALDGLAPPPHVLATGAPTFGDLDLRLKLCEAGSGRELFEYLREHPDRSEQTVQVYRYFDASYFAPFIDEKSGVQKHIAGVGLHDPIVPAETVYSIYNALGIQPELFELPCSHTERPEEAEWVKWESAWIRAAKNA